MTSHSLRAPALVIAASLACSSSPPGTAGADGGGDAAQVVGQKTSRSGQVYERRIADGGLIPIERARVCILGRPDIPCATTDQAGDYTLALPATDATAVYAVSFAAEGHLARLRPAGDTWWPSGVGLFTDAQAAEEVRLAGFTYPPNGTGFVEVRLLDGGTAKGYSGATVTLSGGAGSGPVYGDPAFKADRSLTTTSSSGMIFFGNVQGGPVTITVKAPDRTCDTFDVQGTWPASGPNVMQVPVAPDASIEVTFWCR
jgi:hypothetical protein